MVPLTFNKYIGASSSEMFSSLDYSARDACKLKCIAGYNIQSKQSALPCVVGFLFYASLSGSENE